MLAVSRQSELSGHRRPRANWTIFALALSTLSCDGLAVPIEPILPWARHTIDNSSSGADGVRGADINGDGWLDLVTPWEESGEVKVYIHPGADGARLPWPSVIIANVGAVEDAVFVDLDEDGALDVVSSAEGSVRSIFVHFAPSDPAQLLDAEAWQTQALPAARNQRQWMFCAPAVIDGRHGVDLIAGAKEDGAMLGWFEAPSAPRNLAAWTWHPIAEVGWVMSIIPHDVNGDGAIDVIATDRKGSMRGCWWFENPGQPEASFDLWPRHLVGGAGEDVMFADLADLNGDGRDDLVAATDAHRLLLGGKGGQAYFQR